MFALSQIRELKQRIISFPNSTHRELLIMKFRFANSYCYVKYANTFGGVGKRAVIAIVLCP